MQWFEPIIIIATIAFVLIVFITHFKKEYQSGKRAAKTGKCSCKGCCCCTSKCDKNHS